MILPLPEKFDENEIFIIFSTVFALVLMFIVPRRLSAVTIVIIWTFNVFLALLADITISIKPYNFYFTIDHDTHELFDVLLHFATYPTVPYFLVNLYQYKKPRGLKLLSYIIFFAGVAIVLEYTAVQFHVFTYTGWKLYLSFITYLILFAVNIELVNFIGKKHPYKRESTS
ncbi:hypothetical protein EKG37_22255 [Robertmurraya yapensis]|uniref:Uncharacterized protein n=1 Tax=Bacillus yapensis TaxID=2492960 RepID=A0A3S0K9X4_9BACI|nr:hypothetical protein [Bacillus yapensis]RTR25958.1 hypothetical protein EKG37_22255 [Bacillus yapensis]TKS93537.1 hypothetical protein FAR12_22260 [Bacillus yapensis]